MKNKERKQSCISRRIKGSRWRRNNLMQWIFLRCFFVSTIVSPNFPTNKNHQDGSQCKDCSFFLIYFFVVVLTVCWWMHFNWNRNFFILFLFFLVYALIFIPFGDHINLWKKFAHKKFLDFGDTQALKLEYFWLWNAMIFRLEIGRFYK